MNFRVRNGKEAKLIAAILAGDTMLYHQLIRPYERSVYIMSLSCMKNEKDAEEVAQEAFIRAFRNLRTFRCDSKFGAWIISIALNEARKRLRRQATIRIIPLDEPQAEEMPVFPAALHDWQELPCDVVEHEEVRTLLQQTVKMLPDTHQQVFFLRDVEELNQNETAQILNIDTSLLRIISHRARMMLQRLLAPKLKAITNASKEAVSVSMNENILDLRRHER